jgi:GNAT superfamily N-acetyltransferase
VTVRPLRPADLDGALAANDAVGWRERRVLFEFYGAREDTALFVAEVRDAIAGTGGATVFPGTPATGWVHGIVVRPEHQRAGLGARLTETAVQWLRARGVGAVLLLATDAGRPVYERLGFVAGERYGAFASPAPGDVSEVTVERLTPARLPAASVLDREATGEDRSRFIASLADGGWVAVRGDDVVGFHLACPWGGGPTIARDADAGLAGLGIAAGRHVTRMWLGTPPPWRPGMIFGVFNFGVG